MGVKEGEGFMKNVHVKEIELKGKEWETILDNAFKKRVKGQTIDGFRKGKAPFHIVEKTYGTQMFYEDAFNEVAPAAYDEAITSEKLEVVSKPQIDIVQIGKGKDLVFPYITKPFLIFYFLNIVNYPLPL